MQECVSMAAAALQEGKVIALPTDTVYGIAALAQSTDAVQKLYEIKGRNFEKPIAISVGNIQDVHKQVYFVYCKVSMHIYHNTNCIHFMKKFHYQTYWFEAL